MGKAGFKSKSAKVNRPSRLRFGSTIVPSEPPSEDCIGICILAEDGNKIATEADDELITES
tara:strand:+ start:188 stop:370 length:183 start_codon:yes stop_codon:yes gene_type:complete